MGLVVKDDAEIAKDLYGGIAQCTEQPEYTEPVLGARRYHAVQNLPKKLRAEVFKGWYDYDIEAAAPTLVYQAACEALARMGMKGDEAPYPHIEQLVKDRTKVRQYLGELTGLDAVAVKQVLIALFFGSKLVPSPKRAIFRILGSDYELVQRLKADPFVKEFCKEVQLMWTAVIAADNTKKGMAVLFDGASPVAKPSKKSKHRMAIYLELERRVMDVVDAELRSQGVWSVLIHDGFMTKTRIDRSRLEDLIEKKTGYRVKLSESQVGKQDKNQKLGLDEELMELDQEVL